MANHLLQAQLHRLLCNSAAEINFQATFPLRLLPMHHCLIVIAEKMSRDRDERRLKMKIVGIVVEIWRGDYEDVKENADKIQREFEVFWHDGGFLRAFESMPTTGFGTGFVDVCGVGSV
ncbi:hypothetical protein RYX36_004623 [Vicia faba]